MLLNKDTKSKPFQGRIYVTLYDESGDDTYPHGIAVAPPAVRTKARAISDINRTLAKVKKSSPNSWGYDDLIDALRKIGWDHISPVVWVEEDQKE